MAQATMDAGQAPATPEPVTQPLEKPAFWRTFVSRNKLGTFGIVLLVLILLLAFIGPFFMSGPNRTQVDKIYAPPSWGHPLGFDYRGRDIWHQIVNGGRSLILVATLAAVISTFIAITFGALAALIGGKTNVAIQTITDVVLTVPVIILLAVLAAFVKLDSPVLLAVILAATGWPTLLLAVRAQVLSLREREYVEAARMLDLGLPRILFREVLPNMASYIIINFVFAMTGAIYGQVILYFLGLVSLSGDNWGLMIQEAYRQGAVFSPDSMLGLIAPIFMIVMLLWSLTLVARSLEDIFNPRLREL
ncbi:MAG TPA: ABC transporter permease [Thermomicrobiales bacterium]|nr:ABC transporter permease [Thermomicrobiales bacterium]